MYSTSTRYIIRIKHVPLCMYHGTPHRNTPEMRTSSLIGTLCMVPIMYKTPEMRTPPLIKLLLGYSE